MLIESEAMPFIINVQGQMYECENYEAFSWTAVLIMAGTLRNHQWTALYVQQNYENRLIMIGSCWCIRSKMHIHFSKPLTMRLWQSWFFLLQVTHGTNAKDNRRLLKRLILSHRTLSVINFKIIIYLLKSMFRWVI